MQNLQKKIDGNAQITCHGILCVCLRVCLLISSHSSWVVCAPLCVCACARARTCVCVRGGICVRARACLCTCVCVYACVRVCVWACRHVCVCACARVCKCVCVQMNELYQTHNLLLKRIKDAPKGPLMQRLTQISALRIESNENVRAARIRPAASK